MKRILSSFLAFTAGMLFSVSGIAQEGLTLYNMQTIPQSQYYNPANVPFAKVNIGLPGISSTYFGINNSGFKYSDLVRKRPSDDSLIIDLNNFLSKVQKNNYLRTHAEADWLQVGFRVKKKNYFALNISDKMDVRFRYPGDFMRFVILGNGALLDETLNFNFGLDATHYREHGLLYAREINKKLSVGGKLKYLYGYENIQTERSDVTLFTDAQTFDITATSNIRVNTSGLDSGAFDNFDPADYIQTRANRGLGIDLGGKYTLNDDWSFSASVLDLGRIKWQHRTQVYQSKNAEASFTFRGVDFNSFINDTISIDKAVEELVDSLTGTFALESLQNKSYRTWLTPKMYFSANYHINHLNRAGILVYNEIYDGKMHPALSLSYNTRAGRYLGTSVSYSIAHRSYFNVGLGFNINAGPVQLYLVSDNIMAAVMPQHAKNFNIRMGLNLTIGRDKLDKDRDGVPDEGDDCPEVKGLEDLRGCPDKDGDKVPDIKDNCPDDPGSPDLNGCPDKDGDRVIDKEDACPDIAGTSEFKGCPDSDGDKIIDKEDACPSEAGPVELKGCPDKDGDKIADKDDVCPEVPGIAYFKGCPDSDGDGIQDSEDQCPELAGKIEFKGCPEIRLCVLNESGKIIQCAFRSKDGFFEFVNLPEDVSFLYKIDGGDVDFTSLKIKLNGQEARLVKDANGRTFKFKKLSTEYNTLKQIPEEDVTIILKKEEAEILKKAFDNLEFTTGKAIIRPESNSSLEELAGLLKTKPDWRIRISGHTDNMGNPKTNLTLSKNRAEAVKKFLVSKGVNPANILVSYYGGTKPIADNKTEKGRQTNRRVEMTIID